MDTSIKVIGLISLVGITVYGLLQIVTIFGWPGAILAPIFVWIYYTAIGWMSDL